LSQFVSSGGADGGGQGTFFHGPGDLCLLEVMQPELLRLVTLITTDWFAGHKVGLYQNDFNPRLNSTIANVVPCNFSGYDGLRLLYFLTPSFMGGVRAIRLAQEYIWQHDGGAIDNWVYGYYVVDLSGNLVVAERFCNGPFNMNTARRSFKLTPMFWVKNERQEPAS